MSTPVVTTTSVWDADAETLDVMKQLGTYVLPKQDFVITNITTAGFTILLEQPAVTDLKFNWTAFEVKDTKTFESTGGVVVPSLTLTPTTTPSPILSPALNSEVPEATEGGDTSL